MSVFSDLKKSVQKSDGLSRLIAINVAVFVVYMVVIIVKSFSLTPFHPEVFPKIILASTADLDVLMRKPWTVITHMFTHIEVAHFLFNIVSLYVVGRIFKHFIGTRRLVTTYLLGGLSGFLLYVISYNIFPGLNEHSSIMGASAAVMALVITIGVVQPNFTVKLFGVFEMKLMWLCIILVFVDLISLQKGFNSGGHLGHLGGAMYGFYVGTKFKKGNTMSGWLDQFFSRLKGMFSGRNELKTVHKRPKTDDEFNAERVSRQKEIDQILDKIGKSGYESLTKAEKDFLFKYSQK